MLVVVSKELHAVGYAEKSFLVKVLQNKVSAVYRSNHIK